MKKIKAVITVAFTIIASTAAVISAVASENPSLKQISLIIMYICIAVVVIMIVIYIVGFFESRVDEKEFTEGILEESKKIKSDTNHLIEWVKMLDARGYNCDTENFKRDYQEFCPIRNSSYAENSEEVNSALFKLLQERTSEIKKLDIICFGRQGFGGCVGYIIAKKINVNVEIIVFNPKKHQDICKKDDESKIRENITTWLRDSDKIEVIVSDIPPMIRAAVAYTEDKNGKLCAIWGTVQSYRFALDYQNNIFLEKPRNSLISICDDSKTVTGDLYTLVNCFEEEFNRLKKHGHTAKLIVQDGITEVQLEETRL